MMNGCAATRDPNASVVKVDTLMSLVVIKYRVLKLQQFTSDVLLELLGCAQSSNDGGRRRRRAAPGIDSSKC